MSAPKSRPRTRLRLLFDEQSSPKVARSLKALDLNVDWVGGKGQPPRGADDEVVLDHAVRCSQVVLTSNHDLIVLCCDRGESLIWLDGRGTSLTLAETVVRCFGQIEAWDREVSNRGRPVCIQSLKTKVNVLDLDDAKRLALSRNRTRLRRERRERKRQLEGQQAAAYG
jgi:predicted nuclease of predicted toxin-antitoxin system